MNEELDQIEKKDTWEPVPRPKNKNVISTKWVFRNKLNEDGQVTRNTARLVCKGYAQVEGIDFEETFSLVCKGYAQVEGIDFEETFSPVARMESI